jgi:sporulation protein YlmC with PRC-barrel domain
VEKQVLGCLVRDIQTGAVFGWVKTIVFDPAGEQVTELLIDPSVKPRLGAGEDAGESLVGRPLFDPVGRYLGEIGDLVLGVRTGRLQGLVVDRGEEEHGMVTAYQGLMWENDHWTLLEEMPRLRSTLYPEPAERTPTVEEQDPSNDWMVGRRSTVRLTDRRGQIIVEPGQPITPGVVEQASRAGVLHRLDAEF